MKRCPLVVCLLFSCLLSAQTQKSAQMQPATQSPQKVTGDPDAPLKIDPAKEADIRTLIQLTGAKDLAVQMMDQMTKTLKPLMTNSLPPGEYRATLIDLFFEKFHSKMDLKALLDSEVLIYDKHFSHQEIRGLIEFYRTPLGQKTLKELPAVVSESGQAGQKWGQDLGRDSMKEVLAEHPDLAKSLDDAAKASQPH